MKSIKPGRGPSALGVWGAVIAVVFGIFWTVMASQMGAPSIFPLFGVLFIITGVIIGIYNFKNATGKNRYSVMDITDENEEPDPLNARFGGKAEARDDTAPAGGAGTDSAFCPYCGTPADKDYEFCRKCGKRLP